MVPKYCITSFIDNDKRKIHFSMTGKKFATNKGRVLWEVDHIPSRRVPTIIDSINDIRDCFIDAETFIAEIAKLSFVKGKYPVLSDDEFIIGRV